MRGREGGGQREIAFVFDLDGVLVDTVEAHFHGWSAVARRLGVSFTAADNEALRGVSGPQSLDRLNAGLPPLSAARRAELLELKGRAYRAYVADDPERFRVPGVRRLLDDLRRAGVPCGVASASRHARQLLARTGLDGHFEWISDGHFEGPAKPAPDQFLAVASGLDVAPADCIVVEDALVGIEAAVAAGMVAFGVGPLVAGDRRLDAHFPTLAGVEARNLLASVYRRVA